MGWFSNLLSKAGHSVKKDFDDLKESFHGDNTKDPLAKLATLTSPEIMVLDKAMKGVGIKDGAALPADWVNKQGSSALNELGVDSDHGVGQWVTNKPGTTIGALITGGMFAGGALGGGAASGSSAGGSSAGAGSSTAASSSPGWQQYARMGQSMGGQKQQQPQQDQYASMADSLKQQAQTSEQQRQEKERLLRAYLMQQGQGRGLYDA